MTGGEEKNIYRTIVKATGLFGGTQVFTILCSIIKTKLVAIWLGAEGVGIIGLYNNTVEMISSLTRLGIGTSSVRIYPKRLNRGTKVGLPNWCLSCVVGFGSPGCWGRSLC